MGTRPDSARRPARALVGGPLQRARYGGRAAAPTARSSKRRSWVLVANAWWDSRGVEARLDPVPALRLRSGPCRRRQTGSALVVAWCAPGQPPPARPPRGKGFVGVGDGDARDRGVRFWLATTWRPAPRTSPTAGGPQAHCLRPTVETERRWVTRPTMPSRYMTLRASLLYEPRPTAKSRSERTTSTSHHPCRQRGPGALGQQIVRCHTVRGDVIIAPNVTGVAGRDRSRQEEHATRERVRPHGDTR